MKKLLSSALVLALGLTCTASLAGCTSDDDRAKNAMATITTLYAGKAAETPIDYTVLGQTKYEGNTYDVVWTVTSETAELNNYVTVGTMDATSKQVTISITQGPEVVEYKLTATITIGKGSASESFNKKIPAKAKDTAGTLEDPHTIAKAKELFAQVESGKVYSVDGVEKQMFFKGFVTDVGTIGSYGPQNVYIADTKGASKEDSGLIYSLNYTSKDDGEVFKKGDVLRIDDEIVVRGYIKNYGGKFEIDSNNGSPKDYAVIVKWEKAPDTRTNAQKIDDALKDVADTLNIAKVGETALATSKEGDVKFVWSTTDTTYTITDNKISVANLPAAAATVTAKVTATCGTDTKDKTVTITIAAMPTVAANEVLLTAGLMGVNAYANGERTICGVGFKWNEVADYGDGIQMRTSGQKVATIWNTAAFSTNISKVVFVWSSTKDLPKADKKDSLKIEFSNSADFAGATPQIVAFTDNKTVEVPVTGEFKYVRITHNNNGAVYLASIKVVCAEA